MIANYTTKVNAFTSVGEITQMLVQHGARAVATEYDDSRITALTFVIEFGGDPLHYTLPVRIHAVLDVLKAQKAEKRFLTLEHAESVAWRIMKDWIRAQMAIIETEMVSLSQVMLPYLRTDNGATVFERWEMQRQLPAGSPA